MKRLSRRQLASVVKIRASMQQKIVERFGVEKIYEASERLCSKCVVKCPDLFPITTEGEDCPYFKPKESE